MMTTLADALAENNAPAVFSEGSDARLSGRSISRNPHPTGTRGWVHWRLGWLHCHFRWGIDRRHNGMRRLPDVMEMDYEKMLAETRMRRSRDLIGRDEE